VILETRDLIKGFSAPVLQGIDLAFEAGEEVAILGPSGAGKTTLIRLLNASLTPTSGKVLFKGQDLTALPPRDLTKARREIGTIYQQFNLVPRLRVVHNVLAGRLGYWSTPRSLLSLLSPLDVEPAIQALREVGMEGKLFSRSDTLSGGEQQRVALARVLVQDPEIILADEPISSVDCARAHELMRLLLEVNQRHRKTLIAVLHQVEFALEYFDRIVGIRDGRILFDAPRAEIGEERLEELYLGT
jgi:phosphonate transport system ATP-binding protein